MKQLEILPSEEEMYQALISRNAEYEGIFFAGIRTTGIFCRPDCPARKPNPENVEYFPRAADALASGYRPCRRCRPMEPHGESPAWLKPLLDAVDQNPSRRWTSEDIRAFGIEPSRVRRWFVQHHGVTFLSYLRSRRLGQAFSRISEGHPVLESGLESGFDSSSGFTDAFIKATQSSPGSASGRASLFVEQIASPLGPMIIAGDEKAVYLVEFWDRRMLETQFQILEKRLNCAIFSGDTAPIQQMKGEIAEYFERKRTRFTAPIHFPGTAHQELVWRGLLEVPHGETWTYGELAKRIGKTSAVRSVAKAVGENRLAVVVPCHRIVGQNGKLTGYGGGLWRKAFLLRHETGQSFVQG